MARRIEIRPLAYVDLAEISAYIARDNLSAARRFLVSAERDFAWLAKHPDAGNPCGFEHPLVADLQCWGIRKFKNYLVLYRAINRGIEVVRVIHGARDIAGLFQLPDAGGDEID